MIELSHIGEQLLSEMINRSQAVQRLFSESSALVTKAGDALHAEPEVPLRGCGAYGFDGAHRLDVALLLGGQHGCLGIEAKLGKDRLNRNAFESHFLTPCWISHDGTRIAGPMISILDGRLPPGCDRRAITVEHNKTTYQLRARWFLVVRGRVLNAWSQQGRPELSDHCTVVDFETIVKRYGNREEFNSLVAECVRGDYYQEWFGG